MAALRNIGIQPDAIVCRSDREIPAEPQAQDLADVRRRRRGRGRCAGRAVASTTSRRCCTARASTPTSYAGSGCRSATSTGRSGTTCCAGCTTRGTTVTVALVGKYIDLPDAYLSVTEALRAGGFANDAGCRSAGCPPTTAQTPEARGPRARRASTASASPAASASAASRASSARSGYARENGIPTLGLCLGLQCMVIEYARNVAGPRGRQLAGVRRGRRRTRSSPPWPTRRTSSPASATWAARCGSGSYPAALRRGLARRRGYGATVRRASGTGTATRSTTPTATQLEQGRAGLLRHLAGRAAGRVRRAAARRAPVLRGHPGAPGVQVPPDPAAPAVRRRSSRPRWPARRGRSPASLTAGARRDRVTADRDAGASPTSRPRCTVRSSETVHDGMVWDVRRDEVELADGQTVTREVIDHTGAVGVVALDDQDRVLLLRQYRHPVGAYLWELPAGLLDVAGEDPLLAAAARAGRGGRPGRGRVARAGRLLQLARAAAPRRSAATWPAGCTRSRTPSGTSASTRSATWCRPGCRSPRRATWCWPASMHNPTTVCGILAAAAARDAGWDTLRPADAPWPERSPGRGQQRR